MAAPSSDITILCDHDACSGLECFRHDMLDCPTMTRLCSCIANCAACIPRGASLLPCVGWDLPGPEFWATSSLDGLEDSGATPAFVKTFLYGFAKATIEAYLAGSSGDSTTVRRSAYYSAAKDVLERSRVADEARFGNVLGALLYMLLESLSRRQEHAVASTLVGISIACRMQYDAYLEARPDLLFVVPECVKTYVYRRRSTFLAALWAACVTDESIDFTKGDGEEELYAFNVFVSRQNLEQAIHNAESLCVIDMVVWEIRRASGMQTSSGHPAEWLPETNLTTGSAATDDVCCIFKTAQHVMAPRLDGVCHFIRPHPDSISDVASFCTVISNVVHCTTRCLADSQYDTLPGYFWSIHNTATTMLGIASAPPCVFFSALEKDALSWVAKANVKKRGRSEDDAHFHEREETSKEEASDTTALVSDEK